MVKLGCMKCEKVLMKQLGKTRDEQSINKRKINISVLQLTKEK